MSTELSGHFAITRRQSPFIILFGDSFFTISQNLIGLFCCGTTLGQTGPNRMHRQPIRGGKFVFFYEYDQIDRLELIDIKRHGEFISTINFDGVKFDPHRP